MNLVFSIVFGIGFATGVWTLHAAEEEARTLDAAGGWSTNTRFEALSAACQFMPAGTTTNAAACNRSGFLSAFLLHPHLDCDADGLADEDDPDDDNDGLGDLAELTGTAFDPIFKTDPLDPDMDDDGMSDGEEAVAGTNPDARESLLRILDLDIVSGGISIVWQSRGGRTYDLLGTNVPAAVDADAPILDTITASGGTAPWYETRSTGTLSTVTERLFMRIRVKPLD